MTFNNFTIIILSIMVINCGYQSYARPFNLIKMGLPGGSNDLKGFQNSVEIESLGKFAVQEHNKEQNALLEFVKVLKVKEQVVAGTLYHLTLEAIDAGRKKTFEAKVWVKPWMNFKQLQEFKHAEGGLALTPSDLGVRLDSDGQKSEWQAVPTSDPEVQNAANHAVKSIQLKSNSLSPYKLVKILLAKAKVLEDQAKYDLLLRLKRGTKEENFGVEVTKDKQGKFNLN
ncbi:Cysteine proteinase inhibitor 6 [Euphorbia peplus]|nr:Cysteine proteinase inhibitor 6 [Euphorbia peplus]